MGQPVATKNTTGQPRQVPEDISKKQDPEYSEQDFENALDRVTRRLEDPSPRDPESPRTESP